MEEFTIKNDNRFVYRMKRINALQLLALRSQLSFENFDSALNTFDLLLQLIEVRGANDTKWLPVKVKGEDVYFPAFIQEDPDAMQEIAMHAMEYLKSVFRKSTESKSETE